LFSCLIKTKSPGFKSGQSFFKDGMGFEPPNSPRFFFDSTTLTIRSDWSHPFLKQHKRPFFRGTFQSSYLLHFSSKIHASTICYFILLVFFHFYRIVVLWRANSNPLLRCDEAVPRFFGGPSGKREKRVKLWVRAFARWELTFRRKTRASGTEILTCRWFR